MMRYRKIATAACILMVWIQLVALTVPSATEKFYTNDFAGILSEDTKEYIFTNSKRLNEKTGAQVVVATVSSLDGSTVDEYGLELARKWGIGSKEKNNGVLILLAPNERKARVEVGYGLEGAINDAKAGRFLDTYATPSFKSNNWDEGIRGVYSAVVNEIYKEYNIEIPQEVESNMSSAKELASKNANPLIAIFFPLIVISLVLFSVLFRGRNNRYKGPRPPFSGGGFYGGGGGGFSGGGGSFGGGGSSRGF